MDKRKILIQIDTDAQPSVFDRVVAVDAGAEEIFSYGGVKPDTIETLIHGAIFTRGPKDLKSTAFFIGGSNIQAGETLLQEALKHMLPQYGLRCSVLFDANGCNTTAAAAVRAAADHLSLDKTKAIVLGGTGPVGQRVAFLLAQQGTVTRLASRKLERAQQAVEAIQARVENAQLEPVAVASDTELSSALKDQELVISAGALGALMLPLQARQAATSLKVAIDLNAFPPLGIEGVESIDRGAERDGMICYGAQGVGATKMKIHKAAIARLFESNDLILDAEEIYSIAQSL